MEQKFIIVYSFVGVRLLIEIVVLEVQVLI
jgi:hypothetical protein